VLDLLKLTAEERGKIETALIMLSADCEKRVQNCQLLAKSELVTMPLREHVLESAKFWVDVLSIIRR
jgi:hypothetical protein